MGLRWKVAVRGGRGLVLFRGRGCGRGVLALLVLCIRVSTLHAIRPRGACAAAVVVVMRQAAGWLTLVRRVKPGNVDAVDLIHGRREGWMPGSSGGVGGRYQQQLLMSAAGRSAAGKFGPFQGGPEG